MSSPSAIEFTESAAKKVCDLASQQNHAVVMLRVYIEGGGCSGFQYGFELARDRNDDDTIIEKDGVKLIVDPLSFQYLAGSQVDYRDDLMGARFVVNNPNAVTTCGCGASFAV